MAGAGPSQQPASDAGAAVGTRVVPVVLLLDSILGKPLENCLLVKAGLRGLILLRYSLVEIWHGLLYATELVG